MAYFMITSICHDTNRCTTFTLRYYTSFACYGVRLYFYISHRSVSNLMIYCLSIVCQFSYDDDLCQIEIIQNPYTSIRVKNCWTLRVGISIEHFKFRCLFQHLKVLIQHFEVLNEPSLLECMMNHTTHVHCKI